MKKLIDFLFRWDGLWSAPLLIVGFLAFGFFSAEFFGEGASSYDPGIIQAIILGSAIIVAINFVTWLGIKFNFPDVFHYYTESIHNDFKQLQPWQRIFSLFALYFFLFSAFLFVLHLIV